MNAILTALRAVPGFKLTDRYAHQTLYGTAPGLFIRVLRRDDIVTDTTCPHASLERRWTVQIAERKTFDRWANSTSFETEVWWSRRGRWTIPDFAREFAWCRRVCRSGLFDFGSYCGTVKTPWFIHPRKRS